MDLRDFAQKIGDVNPSPDDLCAELSVKVVLKSGELLEIEDVRFSAINGGEFHVIAGPAEEEDVDIESEYLPPHLRSV